MTKRKYIHSFVKLILLLLVVQAAHSQSTKALDSLYYNVNDSAAFRKITDSLLIRQAHYMSKNLDSTIFYTNVGVRFSNKIDYDEGVRKLYTNLGIVYIENGKIDEAIIVLKDALDYSFKVGTPKTIAQAYNNLGACYIFKKNYYKTVSYYNEGIAYLRGVKDADEQEALLTYNVAIIYYLIKDYENALIKTKEVEKINLKQKNKFQLTNALNLQGNIYLEKKELDLSYTYFNKALEVAKQIKEKNKTDYYLIDTYINFLNYYIEAKKFDEISDTLNKVVSINYNYRKNDVFNTVINYAKARVAYSKNNLVEAKKYALLSVKQSKDTELKTVFKINQLLLNIAKKENSKKDISTYAVLNLKLKDSLYNEQNDMLLHKEQVAFEINKKKLNQIKLRIKTNEDLLNIRKKHNKSIAIGIFILSLFLVLIWFKERKILKSKDKQLQLVKEKVALEEYAEVIEETLSQDLHDNFGNNVVGVISAHQILLDINKKINIEDPLFKKFSRIIKDQMLPLTYDIKDIIWASKKSNNTLNATLKRLKKIVKEKYKEIKINVNNEVDEKNIRLPKFANKQLLILIKETLNQLIKTYNPKQISVTTLRETEEELVVKVIIEGENIDIEKEVFYKNIKSIKKKFALWNFDFNVENFNKGELYLRGKVIQST